MEEIRLGDLITLQRGFDITKNEQIAGQVPVVSSGGISSYHNVAKVEGPGVVIGRKGTLGTVFYVDKDFWPHDTSLWVRDFKGNDPKFIYYFLKVLHFENFDAGAANPTLNRNHVHALKLRVPKKEQRPRIAATLSAYDDLIDNNRQRIALLEELAEELYREWFVRLRFPGWREATWRDAEGQVVAPGTEGALPEGWGKTRFTNVADILSGGTPSTKEPSFWGGDIPFFSPKDHTGDVFCFSTQSYITEKGLINCNSRLYEEDTVFITARGTVGKLILTGVPMAMNQSCFAIVGKGQLKRASYFLFQMLLSEVKLLQTVANGATFSAITIKTFENMKVVFPGQGIVDHYSDLINPLFREVKILQQKNHLLRETRDLLLPRLMSGKLEV